MAGRLGREECLARLRSARPAVLPSLLMCDWGNLEREVRRVEEAGVAALHLDVMDGHFVPNLSYGLPLVEAIRGISDLPLDVHLMIEKPGDWIECYYGAGADGMTIHAEAVNDPRPVLEAIRKLGAWSGLSINPPTPVTAIEASLPYCDLILVMSVMPGFGGQKFDEVSLPKLRWLRERSDSNALLEIDGGIGPATIGRSAAAGAELFVAGSAVFKANDYGAAVREMEAAARVGVGDQVGKF